MYCPEAIFRIGPINLAQCTQDPDSDFAVEPLKIGNAEAIIARAIVPVNKICIPAMRRIDGSEFSQCTGRIGGKPDTGSSVAEGADSLPVWTIQRQRVCQSGRRFNDGDQYIPMLAVEGGSEL